MGATLRSQQKWRHRPSSPEKAPSAFEIAEGTSKSHRCLFWCFMTFKFALASLCFCWSNCWLVDPSPPLLALSTMFSFCLFLYWCLCFFDFFLHLPSLWFGLLRNPSSVSFPIVSSVPFVFVNLLLHGFLFLFRSSSSSSCLVLLLLLPTLLQLQHYHFKLTAISQGTPMQKSAPCVENWRSWTSQDSRGSWELWKNSLKVWIATSGHLRNQLPNLKSSSPLQFDSDLFEATP